jgi:hypothetical protein
LLESRGEFFAQFGELGVDDHLAIGLVGVVAVIILLFGFGFVEMLKRDELGDNGIGPEFGDLGHGAFGDLLLLGAGIKDDRAVVGANVIALAVEGGGVVDGPKNVEDVGVGNNGGVVLDAHGFGMAGGAARDLLVGGVGDVTASITGRYSRDALNLLVGGLQAPKTSSGKDGGLELRRGSHAPSMTQKKERTAPDPLLDSHEVSTIWHLQYPCKSEQTQSFAFLIAAPPRLSNLFVAQAVLEVKRFFNLF